MKSNVEARISEFLSNVTAAMGLSLTPVAQETADGLRFDLQGEGAEVLIRQKGEALSALQQIVNLAFRRDLGDTKALVDCLGFKRDKDAELRQMARFLAEKAKTSGTPQEIGPLNAYERRIVHMAVAEDPDATSESIGDAAMKTVIISAR